VEYVIFVFVVLAIWHWWYETILAPSLRLELRFKLFKLRDELRDLKIRGAVLDDKHFHYLHDSINNAIHFLPRLDMAMLIYMARRMRDDKEFNARVTARSKVLDDCKSTEAMEIRTKTIHLVATVLSVNSGAWFFYLIPVALAMLCYQWTKNIVKALTALSAADLQTVAPDSTSPAVSV